MAINNLTDKWKVYFSPTGYYDSYDQTRYGLDSKTEFYGGSKSDVANYLNLTQTQPVTITPFEEPEFKHITSEMSMGATKEHNQKMETQKKIEYEKKVQILKDAMRSLEQSNQDIAKLKKEIGWEN